MTAPWRRSIRGRLSALMMLASTMTILLATVGFITSNLIDEAEHLRNDLKMVAQVIGSNSVAALTFGDSGAAREVLGALRTMPSVMAGCIYNKDGSSFATYASDRSVAIPNRPGPDGVSRRGGAIELFQPIMIENERIGTVYIASDLRNVYAALKRYAIIVVAIVLGALIAAFILSSQLQRVISEPISELARVARNVSAHKDYSLRAVPRPMSGNDEISELVIGFNAMLTEIERRDAKLEHQVELRTRELRTANRKNELVLHSIGEGVLGCSLSGEVMFANPASLRMLGRDAKELAGQSSHALLHHTRPDGSPYAADDCPCALTLKDGVARHVHDEVLWRKDGTSFPVEYFVAPMLDEEGEITGVTFTFRDITERLAIDKMKNEFVSTVSHELRTPLTSIRGALGLLGSGMLGNVGEKGQRMLEIAISNTDRLVRLINDILDLERIDSGRVELNRTDVVAGQLMMTAAEGLQAMAQQAGVEIAVETSNASLWADSDRIVQTLTNLLSNAIKFSPPKTTVTLSGATAVDGAFTFRVADQGRGIPRDKLETIFERFKQVDASDSRDKGGSGLGLAICRSIVNAHGGKIWAGRNGQKGSVFQFTIPPRATTRASAPKTDVVPRLILVCEDDRAAMIEMSTILQRSGFSVISVTTPHEVTGRAEEVWPDAIVLDLATNSGKGWEIVDQLKANLTTREIPIVVAAIDQSSVDQSCAEGIAGWVRKPMEGDNLAQAVAAACARPAILIVEDDLDLARVMATSLQSHGIKTLHAANGREAVDLCKAHQPALIVLDLILPDIDGFTVVSTLREDTAFSSVPLLVYSAREVRAAEQPRLRLGPTEFLTKSRCSLEDVENHIVRLLNSVTARSEENENVV